MSYSVRIDRLDAEGVPNGRPAVEVAASEQEALTLMRRAVELARTLPQAMLFSVYGPGNRLLLSYASGRRDRLVSAGAGS